MNKKLWTTASVLGLSLSLWAFEWPVSNVTPEKLKTFFAQKRGSVFSSSLFIENSPEKGQEEDFKPEVHASENGKVLVLISDISDDNDFFPSTLGQAVILTHSDSVISVYGNLSKENSLFDSFESAPIVDEAQNLGLNGNTSWIEKNSPNPSCEIKIIDTKKEIAINPRILLPRLEKEKSFAPSEIILENKDGKHFDLSAVKSFPAGNYKFYQKRNDALVPLKTSLNINGEIVDEINFASIIQNEDKLYLSGMNKKYETSVIYPDDKMFLSGETRLSKGKCIITIENTTNLGEKRMVNYNITVW